MLCFMVMTLFFQKPTFATEITDVTGHCQLGVSYVYQEVPFANLTFSVYRVGEVTSDGTIELIGKYADYPVELNALTVDAFQKACNTLYDYIQLDQVMPEYTMTTDENGYAMLTGLPEGFYLVSGERVEDEEHIYYTNLQFVTLPYERNTSVTLQPKCFVEDKKEDPITLKVLKKWLDEGYENERPAQVTVHLMKDGEVYDTVSLTAENNWRHTWPELEAESTWSVVEDIPANYTVVVSQEGITFVVSNTYVAPTPTPTPTPTPPPDIPQTGMLWWPVPVLAIIGVILIGLGCVSRRKDHDEA